MSVTLSPSRLNLFADCKRCFWLRTNEGVNRPRGAFPSLPQGMDGVIKAHFDRYRQRGTLPPELTDLEGEANLLANQELLDDCRMWQREPKYYDEELDVIVHGGVDDLLRAMDR